MSSHDATDGVSQSVYSIGQVSIEMALIEATQRLAVSCAAGRRVDGGGRWQEAGTRQCACGRPVERQERWVVQNI